MDAVDYGQKINELRTDYRKKFAEQRNIHRDELDAAEERQNKKIKTQQEAYIRDRREIERSSADELGKIKKRTDDLLQIKQKRYKQALGNKEDEYERSINDVTKRFDKRFSGASDAYHSALDNLKHVHATTMRTKSNDMNEKVDHIRKKYDEATDRMQNYTEKSLREMKDKQLKYRENYMSKKQNEIENLNRQQVKHLMDTHEKYDYKLGELKDSQGQRIKSLKEQMQAKTERKRKEDDNAIRAIGDKYEDLFKDFQDTARINTQKQDRRYKEGIAKLVDQHDEQMDFQKRRYHEAATGGGEVDDINDMSDRERHDAARRIENLKEEIRDRDLRYLSHNKKMTSKFTEDMRDRNKLHRDNIEDIKGEYRVMSWDLADEFRRDKKNIEDTYRKKMVGQERHFSQNIKTEHDRNSDSMRRLKKDFGEAIHALTEKNLFAISSLQDESAEEKRQIIEGAKERLHRETKELRDDFDRQRSLLVESQEKRDVLNKNKIISLETRYQGKLAALKKKLGKLLHLQLKTHEELRDAERKKNKNILNSTKREGQMALDLQRERFNSSLSKAKREADQKISNLTNYYEDQILQNNIDHNREMREKVDQGRQRLQTFVEASSMEREQMRQSFEAQMDEMRAKLESYKNSKVKHT